MIGQNIDLKFSQEWLKTLDKVLRRKSLPDDIKLGSPGSVV